jgi:hypothetical protein
MPLLVSFAYREWPTYVALYSCSPGNASLRSFMNWPYHVDSGGDPGGMFEPPVMDPPSMPTETGSPRVNFRMTFLRRVLVPP